MLISYKLSILNWDVKLYHQFMAISTDHNLQANGDFKLKPNWFFQQDLYFENRFKLYKMMPQGNKAKMMNFQCKKTECHH